MDRNVLAEKLCELPIVQYEFFETKELLFTERVRYVCETECPQYGKSWACPPGVGTVEECQAKCLSYENCLMIATVTEVADRLSICLRSPRERQRVVPVDLSSKWTLRETFCQGLKKISKTIPFSLSGRVSFILNSTEERTPLSLKTRETTVAPSSFSSKQKISLRLTNN